MQKRARCGKMARKGAEKMTAKEFMDFLHILERMKCSTRHGWTSTGRRESVAEHSYRLCAMAFLLRDEFPELDMGKVLDMCIVHDWGEAVTGDIPSFLKTDADEATETDAVGGLTARLPDKKGKLDALFAELLALETPEAKLYKALDRIEAVIHMDPIATGDPRTCALREQVAELVKTVDGEMTIHDFRITPGPCHTNLIFDVVVPHRCTLTDEQIRQAVDGKVKELDPNYYAVIQVDRSYVCTAEA